MQLVLSFCIDLMPAILNRVDNKKIERLRKLSQLLDSKFEGPFGIKFGLDAIFGLIPGFGDVLTTLLSIYIVVQAGILGCGPSTLMRMGLNILIENLIDLVPFLGNIFDLFWKSNDKNMQLLQDYLNSPTQTTWRSRAMLTAVVTILLSFLVLAFFTALWTFQAIYIVFKHGI